MQKRFMIIFSVVLVLSLACSVTGSGQNTPQNSQPNNDISSDDAIATSVAATVAAGQTDQDQGQQGDEAEQPDQDQQPAPTQAQQPQTGIIEGHVCYPSEYIPEMTLYLENVLTQSAVEVPIQVNQGNFSQEVPAGEYIAYTWLPDFSGGGSYSQAVPCGLNVSCTDHTPLQFVVAPGATVSDIAVCDWYGGPGSIPNPPGLDLSQLTGTISGTLGYPSEYIPAMYVVAFNQNTTYWYYVITNLNDSTYSIDGLPPGPYTVVAYVVDSGMAGGYSQSVDCGLSVNCSDHTLVTVMVTAGGEVTDVDPIDFYAPAGTFPPNPVP